MQQSDCLQAIQIAVEANVPVLLWGEPGTGKTAAVNGLAAAMGVPIETVLASLREPSDFGGLPVVIDGEMRLVAPDWARRLAGLPKAVCFFDEITTAAPSTQKSLLRVVHERVVGDLALGSGVRMIAAANSADVAAGGWDLAPPLANRFVHLEWGLDAAVVAQGILGHWPTPQPLVIADDWPAHAAAQASVIAGFLSARPDLVHCRPDDEIQGGRAWPSPRSWDALRRVLAVAAASGASPDARFGLVAGLVGDAAAIEFVRYERDLDLPNPEDLLARPSSYRKPARDDQVHAVVASVTAATLHDLSAARWAAGLEVLAVIAGEGHVDIAAVGVRQLVGRQPAGAVPPAGLAVFGPILVEAGMLPESAQPSKPSSARRRRSA